MIQFEQRKYKNLSYTLKAALIQDLLNTNATVQTGTIELGTIIPNDKYGKISKIGPGVWGYAGDSLAVYVDDIPYPSVAIIELNSHLGENEQEVHA